MSIEMSKTSISKTLYDEIEIHTKIRLEYDILMKDMISQQNYTNISKLDILIDDYIKTITKRKQLTTNTDISNKKIDELYDTARKTINNI